MKLSIVTTLYRSERYIEEFLTRISKEAEAILEGSDEYEIVVVDDGSPDHSLEIVLSLQHQNKHIKVIELSRNFGHHKAMMTGLSHAQGELIFLIDSDLEEPPELLKIFHSVLIEGKWDVVYGCQEQRAGNLWKRYGGQLAWWLIDLMIPTKIPLNQSTVRLMTFDYVQQLIQHREHMTAIGGLWVITGFRQVGLTFKKHSRSQTSYSPLKRLRALLDSITSFSEVPLYGIFIMGCVIFIVSLLVGCWLMVRRLTGTVLDGWVSVMLSVWLLGGLLLLGIGIIGLYVSRIFIETKNRPYAIIRKIHN